MEMFFHKTFSRVKKYFLKKNKLKPQVENLYFDDSINKLKFNSLKNYKITSNPEYEKLLEFETIPNNNLKSLI